MSYRAFKRLLGETSLERKCRFLFGAATLLLIAGSFWWYARQTEDLAYDQIVTSGRLLVRPTLAGLHRNLFKPEESAPLQLKEWRQLRKALEAREDKEALEP